MKDYRTRERELVQRMSKILGRNVEGEHTLDTVESLCNEIERLRKLLEEK